jgi:hypothetical protein
VIVKPCAVVGSADEPPGNVIVNCWPGVTESGTTKPTVTSWVWLIVAEPSTAVHCTPGKVCEIV